MRFLKRFNEDLQPDEVEELKDFCNSSLAYLLDEGYEIDVYEDTWRKDIRVFKINLNLPRQEEYDLFYWNDVKNYYIPFLQMLERRYELDNFSGNGQVGEVFFNTDDSHNGFKFYKLEQVIKDNVENTSLWGLGLMISYKK